MIWLQGVRSGRLLRANDAFARLLGRERAAELDGMGLSDWTPSGERRRSRARLRDMAAGRSRGSSYARRYLRADGSIVHAWVTTAVVDDDDGRPEFAIAHCLDDTERRRHVHGSSAWPCTDTLTGLANRAWSTAARPGPARGPCRPAPARPRPVQARQRQPRPRGRRPAAGAGRRPAAPTVPAGTRWPASAATSSSSSSTRGAGRPAALATAVADAVRDPSDLPAGTGSP